MMRSTGSDGLLSDRLAKSEKKTHTSLAVDKLRHKTGDTADSIPTYGLPDDVPPPDKDKLKFERPPKGARKKVRKKPFREKPEQKPNPVEEIEEETAEELDMQVEAESIRAEKRAQTTAKVKSCLSKAAMALMMVCCVYLAFLIYGAIQTKYVYDENGNIVPEILSVDDIHTLKQYELLSSYYLRTRILYESTLTLDYQQSIGALPDLTLAKEYRSLLEDVSKLATDIDAAEIDIGYSGITTRMHTLVYTHIAVYLQNISSALETGDTAKAQEAIAGRQTILSEIAVLTDNMAALCQTTRGATNADIYSWSPESFIESLRGESNG